MVTRMIGYSDSLIVNSAAFVLSPSLARSERRLTNSFQPIVLFRSLEILWLL